MNRCVFQLYRILVFMGWIVWSQKGLCQVASPKPEEVPPGGSFAPEVYKVDRYRSIWEKSPFVIATKAVPQTEGLAKRFSLTGLVTIGGDPVAFIMDRTSRKSVVVSRNKRDNTLGLELVSVSQPDDPSEATAVIRLGKETGTVQFSIPSGTAGAKRNPLPGQPQAGAGGSSYPYPGAPSGSANPSGARVVLPPVPPPAAVSEPVTGSGMSTSVSDTESEGNSSPSPSRIIRRKEINMP